MLDDNLKIKKKRLKIVKMSNFYFFYGDYHCLFEKFNY